MKKLEKFKARFITAGKVVAVEDWLKLNIKGKWSLKLLSVSDDLAQKTYVAIFDDKSDSVHFRNRFVLGKEIPTHAALAPAGLWNKIKASFG